MDHYILMADIQASSRHALGGRTLMERFKGLIDEVNNTLAERLLSPLTITLGDEFQGVPSSLSVARELALALEEHRVRRGDEIGLRYVLHYGPIETPVNPSYAHEMLGPGLSHARDLLSEAKALRHGRMLVSLPNNEASEALRDAFDLVHWFVERWDAADYPFVARFLDGLDYRKVAEALGRDPSSAWRRERSLLCTNTALPGG